MKERVWSRYVAVAFPNVSQCCHNLYCHDTGWGSLEVMGRHVTIKKMGSIFRFFTLFNYGTFQGVTLKSIVNLLDDFAG